MPRRAPRSRETSRPRRAPGHCDPTRTADNPPIRRPASATALRGGRGGDRRSHRSRPRPRRPQRRRRRAPRSPRPARPQDRRRRSAWLIVTEGARAPTAIAATEAMVFMTVFGKIIGESPAGPRRRYPPANSSLDRKSPCSEPTTMASSGPGPIPASSTAKPTGRHGQAADPGEATRLRRVDHRGERAIVDLGREPAQDVLGGKARSGPMPERSRASAPATASVPPEVSALTVPIPVITTRRRSRGGAGSADPVMSAGGSPEDQAHVLAAEAEGVRQRRLDVGGAGRRPARSRTGPRDRSRLRLAVGGMRPCSRARMVMMASRLPAAAIVCPTSDFDELTRTPPSPNTRASASASMRSFWGVPVPCALT